MKKQNQGITLITLVITIIKWYYREIKGIKNRAYESRS